MHRILLALLVLLVAPSAAAAKPAEDVFFTSFIPTRIDHLIGFTPTTIGIHPPTGPVVPIKVRVGGKARKYIFGNASAAVGPDIGLYMRQSIRERRYPDSEGFFVDRRLAARERRYMKVRADLGRDADVLVVSRAHPACASGVSRAAVRGIADGSIRTWSAAGVPVPAGGDAIRLRRAGSGYDDVAEPRFGAGWKVPSGAAVAFDGGVGQAASGDTSVAAITSWSRARAYGARTCAVPVDGVAVTDAAVRALTHPDAYPIQYVTLRKLKYVKGVVLAFTKFVSGAGAAEQFRKRGMLLLSDPW